LALDIHNVFIVIIIVSSGMLAAKFFGAYDRFALSSDILRLSDDRALWY